MSRMGLRDEVSGTEGRITGHMAGGKHGNGGTHLPWSPPPRYHLQHNPGQSLPRPRRPALPQRSYVSQRNRFPRFFDTKHMYQLTKDLVFLPYK